MSLKLDGYWAIDFRDTLRFVWLALGSVDVHDEPAVRLDVIPLGRINARHFRRLVSMPSIVERFFRDYVGGLARLWRKRRFLIYALDCAQSGKSCGRYWNTWSKVDRRCPEFLTTWPHLSSI